nr:HlyD family efflux transporter periplasmic adaptor subunit [Kineosporia rhizophila]
MAGRVAGPASEDLLKVTGTTRRVTVVVDSQDLSSIRQKQRVTVIMPDQSSVPGTVTAISSIVPDDQDDPEGNGAPSQLRVTVKIGQKRLPRGVDTVKVQVKFIAKARPKVLAVPVGALLALREGGYGVQVSGGELVPVETGLFAMGLVEISGPGIAEGTLVETTA